LGSATHQEPGGAGDERAAGGSIPAASGGRLAALSRLRRVTAERMAASARSVARVTLFAEVDFAEAVRFRAQLAPEFERRYGARLTYDTLVARACALAMAEHPTMNAHWTDAGPLHFEQVDVGVAVALAEGLTVPVVREPLPLRVALAHRPSAGAPAAAFLARVREALEKPYILLT
jgi:pyruvate dehydrogenase E2 component (dihydrolipoamide acetyltransferase)